MLHRDLKPSNLLVNKDCELRIADFGLARGVDVNPSHGAQLTEYVVTRWYRAPELLTGNETYGPGIDMWSVGCILAEMLSALTAGNPGEKAALFPGNDVLSSLKLIVATLGVPPDLSFIRNDKARAYVQALGRAAPQAVPLEARFPQAPPQAVDLMMQLVKFEPSRRLSADDALRHPFLSSLHTLNNEPIALPFDFAFESADDASLREFLSVEINRFRNDAQTKPSLGAHPGTSTPLTPDSAQSNMAVDTSQSRCSGSKRARPELATSS